MRGDPFHNDMLVGRLRQVAEACAATVFTEHPVPLDGSVSYADLVVKAHGQVTVCEAEQSRHRIGNDLRKAVALDADWLLIATPDAPIAQACRRQLQRIPPPAGKLKVIVCPLGAALEILRQILTTPTRSAASDTPNPRKES